MEEEALFKAPAPCDQAALVALNRAVGKTTRKWQTRISRFVMGFLGVLLLADFAMLVWLGSDETVLIVMSLLLGVLMAFMSVFYYRISARRSARMMIKSGQADMRRYVYFNGERFGAVAGGGSTTYEYSCIKALYTYEKYLFIFIDARHAFIADIGHMEKGGPEGLARFLFDKTGINTERIK